MDRRTKEQLLSELRTLASDARRLSKKNSKLIDIVATLRAEVSARTETVEQLQSELAEFKAHYLEEVNREVKSQTRYLSARGDDFWQDIQSLWAQRDELRAELESAKRKIARGKRK